MQIKHIVEKDGGQLVFQGELTGQELAFVVETGLNTLYANGALPFLMKDKKNQVMEGPESIQ
ncbi:MAG: hypothetical protein KGI54_14790 [Pseudomonadota bacterium]|nr:hypothetical protein [Pseudomonadota bacterium]